MVQPCPALPYYMVGHGEYNPGPSVPMQPFSSLKKKKKKMEKKKEKKQYFRGGWIYKRVSLSNPKREGEG